MTVSRKTSTTPTGRGPERAQAARVRSRVGRAGSAEKAPSAWERVRPTRASDEIVGQVRGALFEGRLRPGEALGSEAQLAEQFGVSRTTIRDALRSLEAHGIVEIRTGVKGGVRVARGDPNRFADGLAVQLALVGLDFADALAAQLGLEWVGAELAAAQATAADLDEMARLVDRSEELVDDGAAFTECSVAFHQAVGHASHNWAIVTGLRAIREILRESHARYTTPERARKLVGVHRQILDALRAGEGERAGLLMRQHIGVTRASVVDAERPRAASRAYCA